MIELPEAMAFAEQMNRELRGKQIRAGTRGNAPHKFAFCNREPEEYSAILPGRTIGEASTRGGLIVIHLEPGYALVLGGGGERILLHAEASTLPKKHQLFLELTDGTYLTVTVQGWGATLLLDEVEVATHPWLAARVSPLSEAFTWEHFSGLFGMLETEATSVKYFFISKPGVWGVGNGYLQDILYRAKVHPKKRVVALSQKERRALYAATRKTLQQAVELGGRDSERDLHDRPGRYRRLLHSGRVGEPCDECGTAIEKISWLGGACYFCPQCQQV
jgi:formamidopyrimidine-DNA glycosylase